MTTLYEKFTDDMQDPADQPERRAALEPTVANVQELADQIVEAEKALYQLACKPIPGDETADLDDIDDAEDGNFEDIHAEIEDDEEDEPDNGWGDEDEDEGDGEGGPDENYVPTSILNNVLLQDVARVLNGMGRIDEFEYLNHRWLERARLEVQSSQTIDQQTLRTQDGQLTERGMRIQEMISCVERIVVARNGIWAMSDSFEPEAPYSDRLVREAAYQTGAEFWQLMRDVSEQKGLLYERYGESIEDDNPKWTSSPGYPKQQRARQLNRIFECLNDLLDGDLSLGDTQQSHTEAAPADAA